MCVNRSAFVAQINPDMPMCSVRQCSASDAQRSDTFAGTNGGRNGLYSAYREYDRGSDCRAPWNAETLWLRVCDPLS